MTARLDVSGRVNALVCRHLECSPDDLLTAVELADLGADDLDVYELVDQLEHEFDIDLGWMETDRLTLDELHEACERKVGKRHG